MGSEKFPSLRTGNLPAPIFLPNALLRKGPGLPRATVLPSGPDLALSTGSGFRVSRESAPHVDSMCIRRHAASGGPTSTRFHHDLHLPVAAQAKTPRLVPILARRTSLEASIKLRSPLDILLSHKGDYRSVIEAASHPPRSIQAPRCRDGNGARNAIPTERGAAPGPASSAQQARKRVFVFLRSFHLSPNQADMS